MKVRIIDKNDEQYIYKRVVKVSACRDSNKLTIDWYFKKGLFCKKKLTQCTFSYSRIKFIEVNG